jgi:hypothetical protein
METSGFPPEFREHLARALKTRDATALDAAERDYRGAYASVEAYVREQLAEHLPPFLHWLLACCDPSRLRAGYENRALRLWTLALPDGRVLLFESARRRRSRRR